MWVTSTWSLVGTHPESNLGHHNDRWMVTYPRGRLSLPIVLRIALDVAERSIVGLSSLKAPVSLQRLGSVGWRVSKRAQRHSITSIEAGGNNRRVQVGTTRTCGRAVGHEALLRSGTPAADFQSGTSSTGLQLRRYTGRGPTMEARSIVRTWGQ